MKNLLRSLIAGAVAAPLVTACASLPEVGERLPGPQPRVLLTERAYHGRVVQHYAVASRVTSTGTHLHDLYLRVCELGPDGSLGSCKDSLVLEDLTFGSL